MRVDMPGLGQSAHAFVPSSGVATLELPIGNFARTAVRATSTVLEDTLHITSERIVCVHELSYQRQGSEGFLALPTNSLGSEYVVGSVAGFVTDGFTRWVGQFVVVGTQDGTEVTIVPAYDIQGGPATGGAIVQAGVPFTVRLDEGEVIQIRAFSQSPPAAGDTFVSVLRTRRAPRRPPCDRSPSRRRAWWRLEISGRGGSVAGRRAQMIAPRVSRGR